MNGNVISLRAGGPPKWWCTKGDMMSPARAHSDTQVLICNHGVASLLIKRLPKDKSRQSYDLEWRIGHGDGEVQGKIAMDALALKRAFGIENGFGDGGHRLVECTKSPADAAEQGLYFRLGPYLNIPHPGTGMQGDPNISIRITNEIRAAIAELIARR